MAVQRRMCPFRIYRRVALAAAEGQNRVLNIREATVQRYHDSPELSRTKLPAVGVADRQEAPWVTRDCVRAQWSMR
jgi:hypothetical protein